MKKTAVFAAAAALLLLFGCAADNSAGALVSANEPVGTVTEAMDEITSAETAVPGEDSGTPAVYADETARKLYPEMTYDYIEHHISNGNDLLPLPDSTDVYTPVEVSAEGVTENESDVPAEVIKAAEECVKSTENYIYTAQALEKSGGKYILGDYVVDGAERPFSADDAQKALNEDFSPHIRFKEALGEDFDGNGKKEWFVTFTYFDLKPEFMPYETDCCIFVDSNGKAAPLINKSVSLSILSVRGDGVKQVMLDGGCNNSTSFVAVYSVADATVTPLLSEWNCADSENGSIGLITQMYRAYAYYDKAHGRYDLFIDKRDYDIIHS